MCSSRSRSSWRCLPDLKVRLPVIGDAATESVPPIVVYIGVMGWARIHGMVMLGLFEHLGPVIGDTAAFYRYEVGAFLHHLGMATTPGDRK